MIKSSLRGGKHINGPWLLSECEIFSHHTPFASISRLTTLAKPSNTDRFAFKMQFATLSALAALMTSSLVSAAPAGTEAVSYPNRHAIGLH